jgi:hypothetical protein
MLIAAVLVRRFGRSRRASAAVQFAFIAPLFFCLLFAIVEVALIFFAGQTLETATQDSARMILTGQAQNGSYTQAMFKNDLCGRIVALFNCQSGIYIDFEQQFHLGQFPVQPGDCGLLRRGAGLLPVADLRQHARLQRRESGQQHVSAERNGGVLQRTV